MSGMFWIALELSIPKIGFNFMLSLTVKKLDACKFDGVAESDNTDLSSSKHGFTFNLDVACHCCFYDCSTLEPASCSCTSHAIYSFLFTESKC